jgi:putative ABC transport system permease protein
MYWIALKMLTGDRAKYFGLIFGVTFATLLMAQQVSIFLGVMDRTASQIVDVHDADIWVMDDKVRFIDEVPGRPDMSLYRVRGVPGVAWAVKFYKGQGRARLANGDYRTLVLLGLDDDTLVGAPREMIVGDLADLCRPDAVIVDKAGYEYLWPDEPYLLGREFQLNDRRAVLVGVCKASAPFQTFPILYTRYSSVAAGYVPKERNLMTYVLAQPAPGQDAKELCRRIEEQTGLQALTRDQFYWMTVNYFLIATGIPVNFGITIILGFVVGAAITGQTFYLFTIENLKQFGSLKAMGVSNPRLVGMILSQALIVGVLGYGLGLGLTAVYFEVTRPITHLAGMHMTWQAAGGVAVAVLAIITATALLSIRKVLVLEPAVVFR